MKKSKNYRPKKNLWEYNGDGRFPHERIKGKDKQVLKKSRRNYEKKITQVEIEDALDKELEMEVA